MEYIMYYLISAVFATLGLALIHKRRKTRHRIKRKYWVRPWINRRMCPNHRNMLHLYKELLVDGDVHEFRATLRMTPDLYFTLLEKLRSSITKKHSNFRKPITAEARLALTMRYLALGDCFRSLSQMFRIGLSTTRSIVRETCVAIITVLGKSYLRTPTTTQEWLAIAEKFHQKWQFPHCLGCVDGKHVRIIAPRKSGSYFFNYKDFFSVVLMAVVDADYRFIYVDIGSEGKSSDGGIWAKSAFKQHLDHHNNPLGIPNPQPIRGIPEDIPYFLIGDDAFRLGPNMLKPFPGSGLSKLNRIFNYRLCRCRRTVENAFGILSCRFRIFRRPVEVNPDFVQDIVMAACIMHNFLAEHGKNEYMSPTDIDHEADDGSVALGQWRQETNLLPMRRDSQKNATEYAKNTRHSIAQYFLSKQGELPWQYKYAFV